MPEITPIAAVLTMDNGDPIKIIVGKLATLGGHKSGQGQFGVWSFQNGTLADRSGKAVVKIVFKDREKLDEAEWKGKMIRIECSHSEQHGWKGCAAKDDKNKDQSVTRCVWVTSAANIALANGAPANAPQSAPAASPSMPAQTSQAPRPATGNAVKDAKMRIGRGASLYAVCLRYGQILTNELGWPVDQARELGTSLFIAELKGQLNGLDEFGVLGAKASAPQPPPPPPEPEPEPDQPAEDDVPF